MIIKIQRPLATTEEVPQLLFYNQDKSIMVFVPVSSQGGQEIMKGYFTGGVIPKKVYVEASITEGGLLMVDGLSDDQDPGW